MEITAAEVAQYIITMRQRFSDTPLDISELMRLLYLIQRDWLREYNEPLFDDDFIADGSITPKIPAVYREYCERGYGCMPIYREFKNEVKLPFKMECFIWDRMNEPKAAMEYVFHNQNAEEYSGLHRVWQGGKGRGQVIPKVII